MCTRSACVYVYACVYVHMCVHVRVCVCGPPVSQETSLPDFHTCKPPTLLECPSDMECIFSGRIYNRRVVHSPCVDFASTAVLVSLPSSLRTSRLPGPSPLVVPLDVGPWGLLPPSLEPARSLGRRGRAGTGATEVRGERPTRGFHTHVPVPDLERWVQETEDVQTSLGTITVRGDTSLSP